MTPTLGEDRPKDMTDRPCRERPVIHSRDTPQDEGLPLGVEDRPLAPFLDPADVQGKASALAEETEEPLVQAVDASTDRGELTAHLMGRSPPQVLERPEEP